MADKAALDREFAEFAVARITIRCHVCKLPDEVREWVDAKLRAGTASAAISEFLTAKGHKVGVSVVRNHGRVHVTG